MTFYLLLGYNASAWIAFFMMSFIAFMYLYLCETVYGIGVL